MNEAGVTEFGSPALHGLRLSLVWGWGALTPSPQTASTQRELPLRPDRISLKFKKAKPGSFLFYFLIKSPDISFKNKECQNSYKNIGIF